MSGVPGDDPLPIVEIGAAALRAADGTDGVNTLAPPPLFLRGSFHDPLHTTAANYYRALPPHVWSLTKKGGGTTLSGSESDDAGVSMMTLPLDGNPEDEWLLAWRPILADGTHGESGEIWIDLDEIDPESTRHPPALTSKAWTKDGPKVGALDLRRLVRLLVLDSKGKQPTFGFEIVDDPKLPPGLRKNFPTDSLGNDGMLKERSFVFLLGKHGSSLHPWELAADFNWFYTWVSLLYYDLKSLKPLDLPPGTMIRAKDKNGTVVGAGVTMGPDPSGAGNRAPRAPFYVLHHRSVEQSKDVQYVCELPEHAVVLLGDAEHDDDPRLLVGLDPPPDDVRKRYVLPRVWHSHGWRASTNVEGRPRPEEFDPPQPHSPSEDEEEPIRTRVTERDHPLRFYLDDAVLIEESGAPNPLDEDENPVSIFDQALVVRDPVSWMPHVSRVLKRGKNYLFGPDSTFVEGEGIRKLTRLFHYEGTFYSLRERRVVGHEGATKALGARSAIANDHPWVNRIFTGASIPGSQSIHSKGRYSLHLIDTLIDWTYREAPRKLWHLVVTFSAFVNKGDTTEFDVVSVIRNLDAAAARWSPGHPFAPTTPKQYAIVPTSGEPDVVVFARFFFGHLQRQRPGHTLIVLHQQIRSNTGGGVVQLQRDGSEPAADPNSLTDVDMAKADWFTMVHEFGHNVGLPDEYLEPIVGESGLPRCFQEASNGGPARPFESDPTSTMTFGRLPRLRHYWHQVHALNHEPALRTPLGGRDFAPEHVTFGSKGHGLRYELPTVLPFAAPVDPWTPLHQAGFERAELLLYQLGADESAAGAFLGSAPGLSEAEIPLGALVLVRIYFDLKPGVGATADDVLEAGRRTNEGLMAEAWHPTYVFTAPSGSAVAFPNVIVVFQPGFAIVDSAPAPAVRCLLEPASSTRSSDFLLPNASKSALLRFKASDTRVGCLIRYALGYETSMVDASGVLVPDKRALDASELASSAFEREVSGLLRDPPSTERTWRLAWANKKP
jgi:hypothetical protein